MCQLLGFQEQEELTDEQRKQAEAREKGQKFRGLDPEEE